ncbi:hypothetical protein ACLI4Z_01735 [Natrialbaceae archaeon A-arb3/5]
MSHQLEDALAELDRAAEDADGDVREDVRETAAAFEEYIDDDQKPDHAVLDGHLNTLRQARERASGDTEDRIGRALESAESYREELDQA